MLLDAGPLGPSVCVLGFEFRRLAPAYSGEVGTQLVDIFPMDAATASPWVETLKQPDGPRGKRKRHHPMDILGAGGVDHCVIVALFGPRHKSRLRIFPGSHGIPSDETLERVCTRLDTSWYKAGFPTQAQSEFRWTDGQAGSMDRANDCPGSRLFTATAEFPTQGNHIPIQPVMSAGRAQRCCHRFDTGCSLMVGGLWRGGSRRGGRVCAVLSRRARRLGVRAASEITNLITKCSLGVHGVFC